MCCTAFCKLVQRNSTSSGVAWEKLRRMQLTPALTQRRSGSSCSLVGPMVATILTRGRCKSDRMMEGSGKSKVVWNEEENRAEGRGHFPVKREEDVWKERYVD